MKETLNTFNKIVKELLEDEEENPVAEYIPSSELYERMDLSLEEESISKEDFERILTDLVLKTPRTATSGFFNQLFGGRNETAVLGDLLTVMLNNSMYTYKAAGVQIGVENTVLKAVTDIIGWDSASGGTFASGGSLTNFMSMLMARDAFNEKIRIEGISQKMTVYTSKESHYSIPKNAAFCGIGRENVRYIDTDEKGRMIPSKLDEAIEKDVVAGYHPVLVNVTAGTTVMGAFDPIRPISEVCQKRDVWLHVDGAYCGSLIFSEKYKHLLDGLELANSFSFNAHKMINTPLTCSLIVVKDKKHLYDSFSNDAKYLYQTDGDEFNLGKTSLQCGRRNDALKFWSVWKQIGTKGLGERVDKQFRLADEARAYIRSNPNYTLYSYDESISVCFNYKDIPADDICTRLYEDSELMVGYGTFQNQQFIRFVTINAENDSADIANFFKKMEQFVDEEMSYD